MKRKLMLLLACLFVGVGLATAQTQKVTGVVISEEDGQPVIGATVRVEGTDMGAITDVDGAFTLNNVPSSANTLIISFVGMQTQEVEIQPNVRVALKTDAEMLDEVMVVAYGTAKKSSFTGSASTVKSEEIGKIQTSNVANAFNVLIPGVVTIFIISGIGLLFNEVFGSILTGIIKQYRKIFHLVLHGNHHRHILTTYVARSTNNSIDLKAIAAYNHPKILR